MQSSNRSLEELTARYQRFCEKNGLDESLLPEEQTPESDAQQLWLDRHVVACEKARAEQNSNADNKSACKLTQDVTFEPREARPVVATTGSPSSARQTEKRDTVVKENQLLLF